ncbi:Holliday junction branch migration protein RuvA [Bifidobacterium pseudolongum]|uniref:Holliday junction branch migration complex subunit RuvA n=1 Tax=Bifidobacterium pseudolongum subsp. globosum TaxID=1690 RepID=A0A2N3R8K0_9BIFI|nr:Holliday junction branch migration protein RuvA [Bifidobacterium pseudolongum]PKV05668.1 Holliday junction DNA helicase RuvA [Bifidobacterium pseudolongum subsp. globosum]
MIGQLTGTVDAVDSTTAVVDVNGIGFAVRMPNADLATLHIGNAAVVHTEMMVSQDAITLYGFLSMESKRMFLQLLKVNGIGPKVALSLLSTLPSRQLAQAIHDEDATALAKAPGLGKKGAQKIILELKGSIDFAAVAPAEPASTLRAPDDVGMHHVLEGLMSLGWRRQDAQAAIDEVMGDHDFATPLATQDVPQVLRLALAALDTGR